MKQKIKLALRILAGVVFIGAGLNHFVKPDFYVAIMPSVLPFPLALVYISGAFEILGGIGVLTPQVKRLAGNGLALLLLAVFPANINMAINNLSIKGLDSPVLLWIRLPLQFLLIAWVCWCTREDVSGDEKGSNSKN